ncbi:lysophospholipid acyltransferase family protein [Tuwongella immobilis]|uniref:Phospholipid/glycerol acyltransferase domain-containing protein n=1 Tax=Tuwongella immobilis TaxID=692036 RepID=A0A6C2YRT0_9BACT|nr:lysophospholipid acyltransferase family protein [Tuwongella immobilis]VIP04368.1 1-acyl-sn-glycerol-3-phosphate acyltransferase : 1-acyl-sn-glycerol-3-phosphate acyltransferase OS=uncultured planctomycete GN=HGMM_F09D09C25 PE=4 SV=1: Acyltransferase [Tuwongella immobilis]VTS06098.1 1-acyl-sn-glycerol-3-phosphate acyltransferase : 1-acyl-sn-glycerol-3-phosphate acyltransferase OS=uncultured planctomycete GN=HGMM_F09D09C25 PE=4 SV=1: Acyltransferase [Tuwongella immobilis]
MLAWVKRRWYDTVFWITWPLFSWMWSYRMTGRPRMPKTGPVLVLANHQSFFDPVLVGIASTRYLGFLARRTLFKNPILAALIRSLDAVPIDNQGLGKDGLQTVLNALNAGRAVLVFPEGSRTEDGNMLPLQPGITLLIKKVRCPIVPVGIAGAFDAWPRRQKLPAPSPIWKDATPRTIAVAIGEPIDPATLVDLPREEMIARVQSAMETAFAEAKALRRQSRATSPESAACSPTE